MLTLNNYLKKILFCFILALAFTTAYCQDEDYKTIFNENFDSNINFWAINNTELRNSQVSDGKLFDYFGEEGLFAVNVISSSEIVLNLIGSSSSIPKEYSIKIKMANLDNFPFYGYSCQTYVKKSNGKLKGSSVSSPIWGFVWGYKNLDNYHAFILQQYTKREYIGNLYLDTVESYYNLVTVVNGRVISDGWRQFFGKQLDANYHEFKIDVSPSSFTFSIDNEYVGVHGLDTNWAGGNLGPYIGAGSKVSIDYIKIEYPTECKRG